jgi:tetratricopeptide (TPR) repeat protein
MMLPRAREHRMQHDSHGLDLSTDSAAAACAFDHAIAGYIGYRADTGQHLAPLLAEDPRFALAHCLKGYLTMLTYKQANVPLATASLQEARRWAGSATAREQAHIAALAAWIDGEPDQASALWRQILAAHPRDALAFRLAHFTDFWAGRPDRMLSAVRAVEPAWSDELPHYGTLLACRCFAHEECGLYTEAEAAGRAAIAHDPTDVWAAHGVAHVLEMQGRRAEGIAWINALRGNWDGANNLRHHLWWHAAMFHLERAETDTVLALYDSEFRNLAAPLTQAQPDLYIDAQNAASMLFRLGLHGVEVGDRWQELADKAEARIGDTLSAFTLPHWMMALAATGRTAAATRMLAALRDAAQAGTSPTGTSHAGTSHAALVGTIALPLCEAVLAHGQNQPARAVALMRPVLGEMYRLGGSHAQQDVLEQLYLHAALQAGLDDDARLLLERAAGRHKLPLHRRVGYRAAAERLGFS